MGWIAIALALVISSSGGETVRLEVEGQLPCSREELEDAVALRVALSTSAVDLVTVRAGDAIEVAYGDQVRRVDAGQSEGVSAARRIALVVSDLVRGPVTVGLPPLPDPPPPLTATVSATIAPVVTIEEPRPPSFLIGPSFRAGTGLELSHPRFSLSVDASIAIAGPLRVVVGVGGAFIPEQRRDEFSIMYVAALGSAGLGLRLPEQSWEARALGVVETYFILGDVIDRRIDALPGAELAFVYFFALGGGFEAGLGLSLTAYFRHHRLLVEDAEILTTDRVVGALSAGFTWGAFE